MSKNVRKVTKLANTWLMRVKYHNYLSSKGQAEVCSLGTHKEEGESASPYNKEENHKLDP
tara:strand:- start:69 stop:248 length:180 start_codon:yes stop_codon:yes gene_type:complete